MAVANSPNEAVLRRHRNCLYFLYLCRILRRRNAPAKKSELRGLRELEFPRTHGILIKGFLIPRPEEKKMNEQDWVSVIHDGVQTAYLIRGIWPIARLLLCKNKDSQATIAKADTLMLELEMNILAQLSEQTFLMATTTPAPTERHASIMATQKRSLTVLNKVTEALRKLNPEQRK